MRRFRLLMALWCLLCGSSAAVAVTEPADAQSAQNRPADTSRAPATLRWGVDDLLIEVSALTQSRLDGRVVSALRASPYLSWQPDRRWELRLGARLHGDSQDGGWAPHTRWKAGLDDTFIRWRAADMRLTVGAQTIVWGRTDAVPPSDRVSRVDLTRFVLDDLHERRAPHWALRWEQSIADFKLDAVILPAFRGAQLPDERSIWSPINRRTGRIVGVDPVPGLSALVRAASLEKQDYGNGGSGLRITHTGGPADFGVTLARTRQPLPYFRLDPGGPTLTAVHPFNNFVGVDVETVAGSYTWRAEVGAVNGVLVTRADGSPMNTNAVEVVAGVEFFPGGEETRVTLQLAARDLRAKGPILEIKRYYGVNGEIESTFAQGRWKAALRFFSALNVRDVFVSPQLSYLGWEPHELFVAARYFDGEPRSLGGFHRDHASVAVGLRTRF